MDALLNQFGLDYTFFIEFGMIAVLFILISHLYFKPFLKLFEARHKRTVDDREAATKLLAQAQSKIEEYRRLIFQERQSAQKEFDAALQEAKKLEFQLLSEAQEEAKKLTQEATDSIHQQRDHLKKQLENDVEFIAQTISERLLSRKV